MTQFSPQRRLTTLNACSIALASIIIMALLVIPLGIVLQPVLGEQQAVIRGQRVQLIEGDSLMISSNQTSIQRVLVQGNLTSATIKKPAQYPTADFAISTSSPGTLEIQLFFDYASDYDVSLVIQTTDSNLAQSNTTYYMSSGPLELDITAVFNERPDSVPSAISVSPWSNFAGWMGKFGEAFPIWVKLLYFILGIQFFAVGGLWIRRETAKKEFSPQHLDTGDKAFLWVDVAYRFLLVSFLAIILIMGGELVVLFVLRFMFLVSLDWLSLWDLFVVGFTAGAVVISYVVRFTLEKAFDLKPMEDE